MTMDIASLSSAPTASVMGGKPKNWEQIQESAREFESMFVGQMFRQVFDSVPTGSSFFSDGQAEETWRGLLVDEYGKMVVNNGGVGLSDAIAAEMLKIQEMMG